MTARFIRFTLSWLWMVTAMSWASAEEALWVVRDVPAHGLVLARVSLQPFMGESRAVSLSGLLLPERKPVPLQFVPDGEGGEGTLVAQLPGAGEWRVQLRIRPAGADSPQPARTVTTDHYEMHFTDSRRAGYPSVIILRETGKRLDTFVWNDRVHHRELGSFHLRYDPEAQVDVVSDGEVCTIIRVRARYCQPDGKRPPSAPSAEYRWFLFKRLPWVYVTAQVQQEQPFAWDEFHFLEFHFPDASFTHWVGGEPARRGELVADGSTTSLGEWAALVEGRNVLGMWGQSPFLIHDGRGAYGTYLHSTWQAWDSTRLRVSTWLWVGTADDPVQTIGQAVRSGTTALSVLTTPALRQRIESLRQRAAALRGRERQTALWTAAIAERLEAAGDLKGAERLLTGGMPSGWHRFTAGDLGILLEQREDGILLRSLYDLRQDVELLAVDNPPLFSLRLREVETRASRELHAASGWEQVRVQRRRGGFLLEWSQPRDAPLAGIRVTAQVQTDSQAHALRWSLQVHNGNGRWSLWRLVFPQLALAELGEDATVLFPRGPGEVQRGAWRRPFSYQSAYPNGWCSLQLLAAYAQRPRPAGLYFAVHDPLGSQKDIGVQSNPAARSVRLFYDHPLPDMGKAGNSFASSGQAVWQLLRGDWYDAARIYREWALREAKWYPRSGKRMPAWMRELPVWALASGEARDVVPAVQEFARYLGVPTAVHWYNWHQIPFDNDYPHYFPVREGFAEGVEQLHKAGVFVMPYINGRLWDTRDRGIEDFQFSAVAKPAATKDEKGEPYVESYGSREEDGSPVRLAVMCPSTSLWQDKVREIVGRLFGEYKVHAVYIDQVAAAAPVLCFDASHGHPLGGGHWWNEGYWRMLEGIRAGMPADRALTTECNAEPFLAWFDGYLTWHWQYEGQVPVFPAVYSQAVLMFGRAYRGGDTKDLALRMKAAQQLVFGEQIGWIDPGVVREEENARFLKQIVLLRWRYRRFFTEGEMARPPQLEGNIPTVRADWQWAGEWWVSAPALYTGAWQLPAERQMVLFFVNVGDVPVRTTFRFSPSDYGIRARRIGLVERRSGDSGGEEQALPARFVRTLEVAPRQALVWEVSWGRE
ncbi:MAG: DUF6259 domain-containing protein [Armatimonadota bacterium]|nr:DUF6259 domain-containing protein [Armatimonadota bacterium]